MHTDQPDEWTRLVIDVTDRLCVYTVSLYLVLCTLTQYQLIEGLRKMATISKRAADELDAELERMKSEGEGGSEEMNELNEEEYEKERMENIK